MLWEAEEREEGTEDLFEEMMAINFSKLMTDAKPQIQEVHRIPNKVSAKNNCI